MQKTVSQRIDEHTHVPESKLVLNPPFPDSIKIEITSRCNYNCSFCATKREKRQLGDIDKSFLYRILHEAKSIGVTEIGMFLLGESFLVDELAEYIRYAKEEVKIDYVFLTTNGSLSSPEKMKEILSSGLDSIKFSINAGSRERYRKMHGVDEFDTVIENVKWFYNYRNNINSIKPRITISSIYMDKYKSELEDFKNSVSDFSDEFYYLPLYNQAGHVGGKKYTKIVGNPGRYENMVKPVPCWELFNASKITWDGKLTACCFDHDTRFEIADLKKMSLTEAWNNPKFLELRRQHLEGDLENSLCAKCLAIS